MLKNVIAKEGYKPIIIASIAIVLFTILGYEFFTFLSFVIAIFLVYIYRNKTINIESLDKNKIYAPISGTVTTIDIKDSKKSIYINVSLFDAHTLRALEASPVQIEYKRGLNLSLNTLKAKKLNETAIVKFENFTMQLISSIFNPQIDLIKKQKFEKGEKMGVFLHGEVIITFDSKIQTKVTIGQKVQSAQTIIAELVN